MPRRRGTSPQRFSGRAGSNLPGRVRRALDGQIDTDRKIAQTLKVDPDGRMGVSVVRGGGLKETREGLMLDEMSLGDKNLEPIKRVREPVPGSSTSASIQILRDTLCELLNELKRTGRMR